MAEEICPNCASDLGWSTYKEYQGEYFGIKSYETFDRLFCTDESCNWTED